MKERATTRMPTSVIINTEIASKVDQQFQPLLPKTPSMARTIQVDIHIKLIFDFRFRNFLFFPTCTKHHFMCCYYVLQRARRRHLPAEPATIQDIKLEGPWTKSTGGEDWIICQPSDGTDMVIISTPSNIRHLAAARTWYQDGTFDSAPSPQFKQVCLSFTK